MHQERTPNPPPIVAIAGRPNVGKSTLFNRLCSGRVAITDPTPGVTRDPVEATVQFGERPVRLIDTGGITDGIGPFDKIVSARARQVVASADVVLLVLDVTGVTPEDEEMVEEVRARGSHVILVVNKVDSDRRAQFLGEFYRFGFASTVGVSAAHGLGVDDLVDEVLPLLPEVRTSPEAYVAPEVETSPDARAVPEAGLHASRGGSVARPNGIAVAIVGRPNAGKSTLLNRLVGEERSLVSEIPGTTRDAVEATFTYRGSDYVVVDTAGIRRKAKIEEAVEYYSTQRAIDAVERADVVLLIVDSLDGIAEQDKKIAQIAERRGKGVIICLNKTDTLSGVKNEIQAISDRARFVFPVLAYAPIVPMSALEGVGIDELMKTIGKVSAQLHRRVITGKLNGAMRSWFDQTPPPLVRRRPVRFRYATQVGTNPPRFIVFADRGSGMPAEYLTYLRNRLRRDLGFTHVPLEVHVREKPNA